MAIELKGQRKQIKFTFILKATETQNHRTLYTYFTF